MLKWHTCQFSCVSQQPMENKRKNFVKKLALQLIARALNKKKRKLGQISTYAQKTLIDMLDSFDIRVLSSNSLFADHVIFYFLLIHGSNRWMKLAASCRYVALQERQTNFRRYCVNVQWLINWLQFLFDVHITRLRKVVK